MQSHSLKALLIQGDTNSASFCSGLDFEIISELNKADLACAKNLFMTEVLHRLHQLPCVSFAVIHGPAVGGGAELITACDFRIMAEDQNDAYIQFVHAKMGLTPGRLPTDMFFDGLVDHHVGWGGASRLLEMLGRRSALWLLSSCARVRCSDALKIGLIDATYSPSKRRDLTSAEELPLVDQLLTQKASLLLDMKSLLMDLESSETGEGIEESYFRRRWNSPEHVEALHAVRKGHDKSNNVRR